MARAASLKRLWNCCTFQSIWARWMNMHYVKEQFFLGSLGQRYGLFTYGRILLKWELQQWCMSQDNSRNWLWTTTTTRQFSYASAWHIVRNPSPISSLHIVLWFLCHNPKMACCLLRALHDRLLTANRFKSFSIINQDMCALCCEGSETIHICFLMSLCYYIWTLCKLSCVLLLQPPLCMKKLRLSRTVSTGKARIML